MSKQGYWEREDGEPWESVESLPPPSEVSPPTPEPYPWQSLESLPTPFDAEPKSQKPKKEVAPKTKEGWSFRNLRKNEVDEANETHEEEKDSAVTPPSITIPRATTRPAAEDDVDSVGDIEYIPLDHFPRPRRYPARDPYPPYPAPPPWPYPGPLYPGPLRGAKRQGPVHRWNDHPPLIPLPTLVEQLGISAPVSDPRRRRASQRPLIPLSPPPRKPKRSDFEPSDVEYVVRDEKLYAAGREVVFPKIPTYIPPTVKKACSPLGGRWRYEERHTHTHTHTSRRLPPSSGHPAAAAMDPFWEEQARLWPRDKYQNLIPNHPNNPPRMPLAVNMGTLMREWEDTGLGKMSGMKERKKEKEKGRRYRYGYYGGSGDRSGKAKKTDGVESEGEVEERQDEGQEGCNRSDAPDWRDKEDFYYQSCRWRPEWTDEEDRSHRQRGRQRLRRDSVDGHEIDDHNSIHYPPASPQAFNVKRIRDKALKTLGDPFKNRSKGKSKAPAMVFADVEAGEDIYGVFDLEATPKPKNPDPYVSFKKTTGRHPRHFHKSQKTPDEVYERFVLDRRPLAEGEEEPTGKNRRRPMIDIVNLKTGERTRRAIRGYDGLPTLIRVAAGVEMIGGGLPPRRRREIEDEEGVEEGEGNGKNARKKGWKGRRKKKNNGCVMM